LHDEVQEGIAVRILFLSGEDQVNRLRERIEELPRIVLELVGELGRKFADFLVVFVADPVDNSTAKLEPMKF
jgi:hypothetical protein